MGSVLNMIAEKEEEVNRLREASQREMDNELTAARQKLALANQKIEKLKEDFQYNLGLLEDRDSELASFEDLLQTMAKQAEQKDELLAKMRSEAAEMESELHIQWQRAEEAQAAMAAMKIDAVQLLEGSRLGAEEALCRQREEWEVERRRLQVLLAEAEEEIERQRRSMSQGFVENTRNLESGYRKQAEEAETRATIAEDLALTRLQELNQSLQKAEALQEQLQHKDSELHSSQVAATGEKKRKEEKIAELEQQLSQMKVQTERQRTVHQAQLAELTQAAEDAEQARDQAARSSNSLRSAAAIEALEWEQRLEDAQARFKEELASCQEARAKACADLDEQLAAHKAEVDRLRSDLATELADVKRSTQKQVEDLQARLASKGSELASLRGSEESSGAALEAASLELEQLRGRLQAAESRALAAELRLQEAEAREEGMKQVVGDEADGLRQQLNEAQAALQDAHAAPSQAAKPDVQQTYPMFKRSRPEPIAVSGVPADPAAAAIDKHRPDTGSELPSPSTIASPPLSPDYALPLPNTIGDGHLVSPGATAREAIQAPGSSARIENMRSSLEKLIHGQGLAQLDDSGEMRSSIDSQKAEAESIEMENHRLRMTVMEMEGQQEKLKSTVAMMRSEMEQQMEQAQRQMRVEQEAAALKFQVEALLKDKAELMLQARAAAMQRESDTPQASLSQPPAPALQQGPAGAASATGGSAAEGPGSSGSQGDAAEESWRAAAAQLEKEAAQAKGEVSRLQDKLQRREAELQRLEQENEKLMEVGNELRAERNMLAGMGTSVVSGFQPLPALPPQACPVVMYAATPSRGRAASALPSQSPLQGSAKGKEKKRASRKSQSMDTSPEPRPPFNHKFAGTSPARSAKSASPGTRPASASGAMRSPLKRSKVSRHGRSRGSVSPPVVPKLDESKLEGWDASASPRGTGYGLEVKQEQEEGRPLGARATSPEKATQTVPAMVSGRASARELPSQRQRLAMLKRRNEEMSRPRVRNYNVKDDIAGAAS